MNLVTSPTLHAVISLSLLTVSTQKGNDIGCEIGKKVEYKKGFRCRTDTDIFTNLTKISHHLCTHRCMTSRGCILANYNVEQRYCSLSDALCVQYITDDRFVVAFFGSKEALCLKWVSYTLYDNASTIKSTNCHPDPSLTTCALGRLVLSPDYSVPGKYFHSAQGVWAVLKGTETTEGEKEILNIQDDCQVIWVPYTAGDTLPTGAIVGGYLARNGGTDLYIIRARINDLTLFGYYNPMEAQGYVSHARIYQLISMEILVLI